MIPLWFSVGYLFVLMFTIIGLSIYVTYMEDKDKK